MDEQEDLLGDKLERMLKRIGAARVAEAITKTTGKDCGCKKRKKQINDFQRKFQERIKRRPKKVPGQK